MKPFELLYIECSPRPEGASARLGQHLLAAFNTRFGRSLRLTIRRLGTEPLPAISAAYTDSLEMSGDEAKRRYGDQLAVSDELVVELTRADMVLISSPVHNFGIPAVLKCWIDWVVRRDVTFRSTAAGKVGLLDDRPVVVAVAAGGAMFSEPAKQPDFFRPYLRAALGVIGLRSVSFLSVSKLAFEEAPQATLDAAAQAWISAHFDELCALSGTDSDPTAP